MSPLLFLALLWPVALLWLQRWAMQHWASSVDAAAAGDAFAVTLTPGQFADLLLWSDHLQLAVMACAAVVGVAIGVVWSPLGRSK